MTDTNKQRKLLIRGKEAQNQGKYKIKRKVISKEKE